MRALLLACLLVACGGDGVRHTPDAATHDGPLGIDSAVDASGLPVTVRVSGGGSGTADVKVYFQNADSSLVADLQTDATGTASAVMAAGGYVTAIDPVLTKGNHQLYTWSAVKPGDVLLLDEGITSPPGININVSAPFDATAGVTSYRLFTTCSFGLTGDQMTAPAGSGAHATINVDLQGCGATSDVLVVAYNDADQVLDFIYSPGVALVNGQTLDLTAATYSPKSGHDFTYNNNINSTQTLSITDTFISALGPIWRTTLSTAGIPAGTTGDVPKFTGAQDVIETTWYPNTPGIQSYVEWQAVTDHTSDVKAHMEPDYATYPTFDVPSHTTSFTEASNGGVVPDLVVSELTFSRPADRTWDWFQLAPHATTVALPVLPTTLHDYNPASTDTVSRDELIIATVPGGYDAARHLLFATSGPQGLITGATGTLSYERLAPIGRTAAVSGRWTAGHEAARHGVGVTR